MNQEISEFIIRKGTDNVIDEMLARMGVVDFMENVSWVIEQRDISAEVTAKFNDFVMSLKEVRT